MTSTEPVIHNAPARASKARGVRLHHFTVDEYHRMAKFGVFHEDDPIELLDGRLYIKLDKGPPYDVPLGIPPEEIAGSDVEPFPQRRFTVREYHKNGESIPLILGGKKFKPVPVDEIIKPL